MAAPPAPLVGVPESLTPPSPDLFTWEDGRYGKVIVRIPAADPTTTPHGGGVGGPGIVPVRGGLAGPFEFETDLFVGRAQIAFALPGERCAEAEALFAGRRRKIWVMLQGRVKAEVALDDLLVGTWFRRPLRLPGKWVLPAVQWLAGRLAGMRFSLDGGKPSIAGPLAAAAHMLNVALPGEEPRDMAAAADDVRLLLGPEESQGPPMPSLRRRSYFKSAANRAHRAFSPGHVLTIHFVDHAHDYDSFAMAIPPPPLTVFHIDMIPVMDGQAVDITLRHRLTGQQTRIEIWHRRMLEWEETRRRRLEGK